MIPRPARVLVQRYDRLPPMPQLLVKLTEYMRMDAVEMPLKQLANDISADSQATAELLRLINSASAGLHRKVSSVAEAINYLGAKRAISLVFSSATVSVQSDLLKPWSEPLREWYHKRSVLIASTAACFAARLEQISADTAFVLGLLQEIGILVLANSAQHQYFEKTLRRSREVPQVLLDSAELADFQMTHAEVSAALLQRWELPQSLIGPILEHHSRDEQQRRRSKTDRSLMRVMQIGEAFANLSDCQHSYRTRKLNMLLAHYGSAKAPLCRTCLSEATARAAESCELFSIPVPDPETLRRAMNEITTSPEFQTLDSLRATSNTESPPIAAECSVPSSETESEQALNSWMPPGGD